MTSCVPCNYGTFNTEPDQTSCVPWSCAGRLVETPGTALVDPVCGGSFRDTGMVNAFALAITPLDELVVSGFKNDDMGLLDAFVQTHDATGTITGTTIFGSTAVDAALALALDAAGALYVAGYTEGPLEGAALGGYDAFVRKYDTAGLEQWTRQFGTSGEDLVHAVAVDDAGFVYVAGVFDNVPAAGISPGDMFLRKYDPDGAEAWARTFGTEAFDTARDVAVAPSGSAYVVGYTYGDLVGTNAGMWDVVLRKYDSDGAPQWTKQWGGSDYDFGVGVAVDAAEAIYVLAVEGLAAFVHKYDAQGNEVWVKTAAPSYGYLLTDLALDADGNVYVGGYAPALVDLYNYGATDAFLGKYSPSGDEEWTQLFDLGGWDDQVNAIVAGSAGQVYLAGYTGAVMPSGGTAFVLEVWPP